MDGPSSVEFGGYRTDKAKDGKLFELKNEGSSKWAFNLAGVEFNGTEMSHSSGDHITFIDSGNSSIQLPQAVHDRILAEMKRLDDDYIDFIEGYHHGADKIIRVNTGCKYILDRLPPIRFSLQNGHVLEISPHGYVLPSMHGDSFCKFGLAGVPGATNEYRLGTIFLRNFYTVLDYENR